MTNFKLVYSITQFVCPFNVRVESDINRKSQSLIVVSSEPDAKV